MEHQSLYRKYRSQAFDEVMGQQHVTRTLQNALQRGRVAHAYLFCGPRGTGKTSTARLLARALNCVHGPTPTPCGECDMCRGISIGRAMDVVEVDAASETGIDNVREVIINNARYAPAEGRYKVYIIDEVHDLSRAAFDGLLKTLEEPPPHVVFVLATTEIHKVPATIISRCQRFEFRRGSLEEVRSRVEFVAQAEKITVEPAAAALIARSAQGGWRDALSLLEQVMSYSTDTITVKDVGAVLGTIEDESLADLARKVLDQDALGALQALNALLMEGKDLRQLLYNFTDYLRDCMLHAMGATADTTRTLVSLQPAEGTRLLELTARAERELRWNTQHRLVFEMMLLRMAQPPSVIPDAWGAAEPAIAAAPAQPVASSQAVAPAQPPAAAPTARRHAPASSPPTVTPATRPSTPAAGPATGTSAPAAGPEPTRTPAGGRPSPAARDGQESGAVKPGPNGSAPPTSPEPPAVPAAAGPAPDLSAVQDRWKQFLSKVNGTSRRLHALLREAIPIACDNGALTLQFRQQYHYQGVDEIGVRRELEGVLAQVFNYPLRIACVLVEGDRPRPAPRAAGKVIEPVTDADLADLFPGWDIHEG